MTFLEKLGLLALHRIDPETGHGLAIKALQTGLAPAPGTITSPRLATRFAGLDLPNPIAPEGQAAAIVLQSATTGGYPGEILAAIKLD